MTASAIDAGLYELLLRFPNGVEELRLSDQLGSFCDDEGLLVFRGQRWAIVGNRRPENHHAVGRLICRLYDPAAATSLANRKGTPKRRRARATHPAL